MKYRIYSKRLYYELELSGKYTILTGDSGNGKTTLYDLVMDRDNGDKSIHVDELDTHGIWRSSYKKFFAVSKRRDILFSSHENPGSVLVIDEETDIFRQKNAGEVFKQCPYQFLLIIRSKQQLDYLPVSVEGIFHLRNEGKKHFFEHSYSVKYRKNFTKPDLIVTEDSGSGYKIFKEFFPNIPVMSAHSKSEILRTLENINRKYRNILVVYDAAAFGMQIKDFSKYVENDRRNISVLDWYSFEHHVLAQTPFNIWIEPKTLDCSFESLEQAATKKLASIVKYPEDKSSIRPCLTKQSYCEKCNRIAYCKYVHDRFDLGIDIVESYSARKMTSF